MIAHEKYKLTLTHAFVDCDGQEHQLELPITVQQILLDGCQIGMPPGVLINRMMDEMKHYLLQKMNRPLTFMPITEAMQEEDENE